MSPTIRTATVAQMQQQDAADALAKEEVKPKVENVFTTSLAAHIRGLWDVAVRENKTHHEQMVEDKKQRLGIYPAGKMQAMKDIYGAHYNPVYMMLTETKCRALEAWVKEVVLSPGKDPFDLAPTPVPDLPDIAEEMAVQKVLERMQNVAFNQAASMGMEQDPEIIMGQMEQMAPAISELVKREIRRKARRAADEMKTKIADQLREGGWHPSFEECISDLSTYGTAVMKGPVLRKRVRRWREMNPTTGVFEPIIEEQIVPVFERVNPLDLFPGPDNTDIDGGYICHKIRFSAKELSDLMGVEGFDEDAIRRVLSKHRDGKLESWTELDYNMQAIKGKSGYPISSNSIECIEFWGTASGKMLKEWGLKDDVIDDNQKEYNVAAWLIGGEVIKVMVNPNPLGQIPFSKSNFVEDPDNFWGRGGVPRLIKHIQELGNTVARSIQLNVAIAAGPMVEINKDRCRDSTIYPFRVFETTDQGMLDGGKAINFYAPPLIADQLIRVYNFCSVLADEDSGVPKYAHGMGESVGAGDTASGLSMLMTTAARGIKAVIKNLDNGVIAQTVQKMYEYNIDFEDLDIDLIGDVSVVPKGSTSLIAKEQQAVRRNEFLQNTNNPADLQIMGLKGREELLKETAEALELDVDKLFDDEGEILRLAGVMQNQQAPDPAAANVDGAGDSAQGKDFQLEERGE